MKPLPALAAKTLLAACFALPISAMAWGDEGHQVVALVADHYLRSAVRQKVVAMLATDASGLTPTDIASEATWADRFRDSDRSTTHEHYDQTHQWHFVDLELGAPDVAAACFGPVALPDGTPASSGPAQDCVADKIDEFAAELKDAATPPAERLLALQFLLHFVGDLHQPLHAADDHDAGGNAKTVRLAGQAQRKLHAFWDTDLVVALGPQPQTVAKALIAKIKLEQAARWRQGTTQDWALESFGVARRVAYGKLPAPGADGDYLLPTSYATSGRQAVAMQLSRAGVRLAAVLNNALR